MQPLIARLTNNVYYTTIDRICFAVELTKDEHESMRGTHSVVLAIRSLGAWKQLFY